jgi:hypothetical protein
MTERTLIYGTSWINTPERAWLLRMWEKLGQRLNPGVDMLLVNTPAVPDHFPTLHPITKVHTFPDNIGHLRYDDDGNRDGWGRAMCWGAQYAMDKGYTSVAFIEGLLLFAQPVTPIIALMKSKGKVMAQPHSSPHNWMESALTFMDVNWMREIGFPTKYNWPGMIWTKESHVFPEHKLTSIAGTRGHLQLEMLGARDEHPRPIGLDEIVYYDWITHSKRETYEAFLRGHGHGAFI